jgi:thiamine-phosphate pyrophosphorylase
VTAGDAGRRADPALVLVTDAARLRGRDLAHVVSEAVAGGVNAVQLRERVLSHEDLVALGRRVRDAIAGRALLFVNGDIAAAMEIGADGVHLPESLAAGNATSTGSLLVSRAVHSVDAAITAQRSGADLIQLGTVFETKSHPGVPTMEVDGVREACERVAAPVIAIGGITAANAAAVMRAGAAGVAVIGAILDARDPHAAAAELRAALAVAARA